MVEAMIRMVLVSDGGGKQMERVVVLAMVRR